MAKGGKKKAGKRSGKKSGACLPKKKCCVSKDTCKRCPLLALRRGTLPDGYTVKRRRLVKLDKTTKLPKAA